MDKKVKMVTGKVEEAAEVKDLAEIITGRKASKFSRYASREDYRRALFNMGHIDLCNEVMRLGMTPSQIPESCRRKCLDAYDRAMAPRKVTHPDSQVSKSLEDVLAEGRKASQIEEEAKQAKDISITKVKE